jgi:hypothetical protein
VQEFVGGKHDGETGWCGFNFDVSALSMEFEAEQISITTRMGQEPPELLVEGKFRGQEVLLHVCLEPPEGVEATEVIDLRTKHMFLAHARETYVSAAGHVEILHGDARRALADQGKPAEAITQLDTAIGLQPGSCTHYASRRL